MELRVLKYFVTVAQEENMTRAAEVLHTSQSNLSRQLSELESTVGKKLFERGSIAEITDGLNKGLFDFGLLAAPVDMQKYDYIKLPQNDIFGLLMRKDCPLASLPVIHPDDIGNFPVWVAHQQFESNVLSGWLGRDVQSLNIISTFNLITTPAMMIEQGFGMAFTFDNLVRIPENSSLCFRPLEPAVKAELYLVWKKFQMFTKPAELFLESVQKSITPVSPVSVT